MSLNFYISTGTTIDLPHNYFFFQLLTSTCKSVIQRWYAQKASKDNYYFLHQLAKFLRTLFVRTLVVCVCVGGKSGPPPYSVPMSVNFRDCTAISLLDSQKSLSNLAALQILRHSFQPCWQFIAHWSKSKFWKQPWRGLLEQFTYDLEIIMREQYRNNKRMEIERIDWFIEQIQMRVAFGWLRENTRLKKLHARELTGNQPILRFDVILQHDWPIKQCFLHIRVFFGGKMKRPCFDLFIHWLLKQITNTNRDHFSRSYENRSNCLKLPSFFSNPDLLIISSYWNPYYISISLCTILYVRVHIAQL